MKDKIVVFDSGLGGLNIFNALRTKYPNENYVYIADELNLPYGTKSIEFLKKRIKEIIEYFKDYKAIVIISRFIITRKKPLVNTNKGQKIISFAV